MTDELRYERLGISIARTGSIVPRVHGADIHSLSQLYPLLLSPVFAAGLVPHDLTDAHVLNAWVMSSACIPAYLLARRTTQRTWIALATAFLTVCMPWIFYSTMLMTEVAAYPAFLWAIWGLERAVAVPSLLRDAVAIAGLALAFFARTELLVLALAAPVAVVLYERSLRRAVARHNLLAGAYAIAAVAAVVVWQEGHLADVVGVYGLYAHGNAILPPGFFGSFAQHLAFVALGTGAVTVVAGGAWLLARATTRSPAGDDRAFACVALVVVVAMLVQTTNFDVRYTGYVHDRFLLYLVPLFALATLLALNGPTRWPWLLLPGAVAAAGFIWGALPGFTWSQFTQLDPDSPISKLFVPLSHIFAGVTGARVVVTLVVVVATVIAAFAGRLRAARFALVALSLAAPLATTAFTFTHVFDTKDWALRPITASEAGAYDWIDQTAGIRADVSMIPYPVDSDFFISEQRWYDLEFWNQSANKDVHVGRDAYEYTGIWFPKTYLTIDPTTGAFSASPTRWAASSDKETRFQLAGAVRNVNSDVELVDTSRRWRAEWVSSGLYDDGWTEPGVTARFRVFAEPRQRHAEIRTLTLVMRPPDNVASAAVSLRSNVTSWRGAVSNSGSVSESIQLCVPATGSTEVSLSTPLRTTIPGDLDSLAASQQSRTGGIYIGAAGLATEIGGACRVSAATRHAGG